MRVVLAGNPNAGKTTLFNALTKSRLSTGNWHGVTTRPTQKTVGQITYVDVPGMYSFNAYSMEEGSAAQEIALADKVVNVVDAATLGNSLSLTRAIKAKNKNVILYVTKLKMLKKRGGKLDEKALSQALGMPVVSDIAGLKEVLNNTDCFKSEQSGQNTSIEEAYFAGSSRLSRAEKLFYNRYFALAFFICAVILMFFLAFYPGMPGDFLKHLTERLISENLGGAVKSILPRGKVRSLVCDAILGGAGGVISFIPQLAVLYMFLTALDESGVMSALSFVTDGVFQKVNLSGRAVFSLISGFGCTAAAILTTRGFASDKVQKRTISVLPYIPCGAKMPVFLTFLSPLFSNPFPVICAMYFGGIALSLIMCKIFKGGSEELLSEVAPVCLPALFRTAKKLSFYLKGFIIKVATAVMLFCVISWVLSNFTFAFSPCEVEESMLARISKLVLPLFKPMGLGDWRLAYAMISGFAAKENVAATITMLMPGGAGLSLAAGIGASVFILLCPACVSAFSASVKEIGFKLTLKYFFLQLAFAFVCSYIVFFLFSL